MPADRERLPTAALDARDNAYAPYSGFPVGAAVETEAGACFSGCNVENRAFPQTICAERSAVAAAVAGGGRRIVRAYVVSETAGTPCGGCRSVLAELGTDETEVVVAAL